MSDKPENKAVQASKKPYPGLPQPKFTPKTFPVTIGYHSFRIRPGEHVEVSRDGAISIVGQRGKRTETGKNMLEKPAMFTGAPLKGDVMSVGTASKYYRSKKIKILPTFKLWKSVFALMDEVPKFLPFSDGKDSKLFRAMLGKKALIATSSNPDNLIRIDINGESFYPVSEGPARDIPLTADYVRACGKEYRLFMSEQEKQRMSDLQTSGLEPKIRLTKAQLKRLERKERKEQEELAAKLFEVCVQEARVELSKRYTATAVVISTAESFRAQGIPISNEEEQRIRREEEAADERARLGDSKSKEELAALAAEIYAKMRARKD